VLDDLDRQAGQTAVPGARAVGFAWDRADGSTRTWWPQGLTTSADAAAAPGSDLGGRRVLLCGWYAKRRGGGHAATRVSVVDVTDLQAPRYAHVQLLDAGLEPVRVHAGGLAWCGDLLLVADTRRGIRVFDLCTVFRSADGGFRLSQCGSWTPDQAQPTPPLRWSFLSVDRTAPGELSLVAGEYNRYGSGARLARWALDPDTCLPRTTAPDEVIRTDITSMQGVVRVDGTYVVSASHGRIRRGHLWTGRPGGQWVKHAGALPVGPEDLAYDPETQRLWTLTEHPGQRYVLSLALPHHPVD